MSEAVILTDAKGRKLTIRSLNVLDQVKLLRAIGPEQSLNQPYVMTVHLAASVAAIDGVPRPMPTNEKQIDVAIGLLDDAGFVALQVYSAKEMREAEEAASAAQGEGVAPAAGPLPESAA